MYTVRIEAAEATVEMVEIREGASIQNVGHELIGCRMIEIVQPRYFLKGYCIVIDEEGWLKEEPVLNAVASHMYGMHKHGQGIVGNAIVMKNVMTGDGPDVGWLTKEEAEAVVIWIKARAHLIYSEIGAAVTGRMG